MDGQRPRKSRCAVSKRSRQRQRRRSQSFCCENSADLAGTSRYGEKYDDQNVDGHQNRRRDGKSPISRGKLFFQKEFETTRAKTERTGDSFSPVLSVLPLRSHKNIASAAGI